MVDVHGVFYLGIEEQLRKNTTSRKAQIIPQRYADGTNEYLQNGCLDTGHIINNGTR